MNKYFHAMRNGFTFSGRASRSEFWLFSLFAFLIAIVALTLDTTLGLTDEDFAPLTALSYFIHLIPSLAVTVRRLHDTNRSGWWLLIYLTGIGAIIVLVFMCLASTKGPNTYGPAPDGSVGDSPNGGPQGDTGGHGQAYDPNAPHGALTSPQVAGVAPTDTVAQLEKLKALHDSGAIDDVEFKSMKADVLGKAD